MTNFCTCPTEHTKVYFDTPELAKKNPYCLNCWKPILRNKMTEQDLDTAIAILGDLPHIEAINDRERANQIAGRSAAGCLVFIDGVPCCSMHEKPLDDNGDCSGCLETENLIGLDMAEARAERLADIAAEIDDDSTLEENLPFYDEQDATAKQREQERNQDPNEAEIDWGGD